jgi:hypothetical protein
MRKINRFVAGTLLTTAIFASSLSAGFAQQSQCGDRTKIIGQLAKTYSEQPVALGLQKDGRVLEVFSSQSGDSWTILISAPSGWSSVVSSGEGWQPMEFEAAVAELDPGA